METSSNRTIHSVILIILRITTAIMLLLCLEKHPYGYYQILRWVVCISAIGNVILGIEASAHSNSKKDFWTGFEVCFGIIAILFNPIIPVYLSRETWVYIDVIVGIIFVISIPFIPPKTIYEGEKV